jgi:hypothetical protein
MKDILADIIKSMRNSTIKSMYLVVYFKII